MFARFLALLTFLFCVSCNTASEPVTWQEDKNGITYWLVADSIGTDTLSFGKKIKLQLEILKSDSIIYDSRSRGAALELIYTERLFQGSLQSALAIMTPGDSALLKMKSTQFYPEGRPKGLGENDSIDCRIKLIEILP